MQFKIFKNHNIIQGVSEANFGSMAGKNRDNKAEIFLKSLGYKVNKKNFIWAEQVFGSKIHVCTRNDYGKVIKNVDGLLTNIPGQILVIFSADCLPILIFDPKNKAIANLHGSRNSLVKGIIKEAISKMIFYFNSRPKDLLVAIGPHIRSCHYWLKKETYLKLKKSKFSKYFLLGKSFHALEYGSKGKVYFDLTKLALDELLKLGVKRKNIEDCKICTFCHFKKYFSARKREENPKVYQEEKPRFASFIGLKDSEIIRISEKNFQEVIKRATLEIKNGKVLVCPTDTVYGLVADATNKKAVERLFRIKKRDAKKPLPIFIKDIKRAKKFAFIDKEKEKFLKKVWPGKVTVILKRKKEKVYGVDEKTIALRIPKYKFLNNLLEKLNKPLTGTSANISGKPASTKIKEVLDQFEEFFITKGIIPDLIIDAGNLPKNRPSVIIDLTSEPPRILRI